MFIIIGAVAGVVIIVAIIAVVLYKKHMNKDNKNDEAVGEKTEGEPEDARDKKEETPFTKAQ